MNATVYVLRDQSFWDVALPVFVGALAAFGLSLLAFLVRNSISTRKTRKQLLNNLERELKYDLTVIADISKELSNSLPKILSGNSEPYIKLKYQKFLNAFVQEAYAKGVLFELLSEYEIAVFDDVMSHYTSNPTPEAWLRSRLKDLASKSITKQDAVSSFQYEVGELESHTRIINDVLAKIKDFNK